MLDFEYAKALAEVVLDTTCSEKEREVRLEEGAVLSNEALQVLMQQMVKQEVAKAMHLHSIKPEEPNRNSNSVMAVQQESLETITPEVAKSVRDAMSIFRNRS